MAGAADEPRLHRTLDAYLRQMRDVARMSDRPLQIPSTRSLAAGIAVSTRTIQRLRADELQQLNPVLLGGLVGYFHRLEIDVRPAQLVVEPVV